MMYWTGPVPDFSASARADASGNATVRIQHNRSGIVWVVSQIAVENTPTTPSAAKAIVRRNGRYLTSTSIVPASAQGQPFYALNAPDVLEIDFSNVPVGDTAIVTLSYQETLWGQVTTGIVV